MNKQTQWFKNAVVYQIYPKSFMDADGDGLGDLRGIIGKLDYLKELGIDVIWLNPCYKNSGVDGGYDISDYRAIAPELGTMADFDELLDEAHRRSIRIVMDLVVNHTSTEHAWFMESKSSKDNPKRDFYIWRKPFNGGVPNGERSVFSGPAWEYDETTGEYYLHMFAVEQADLNWENEEVRREVYDMMHWWFKKGIDGFRMDVIDMIGKPPEMLLCDGGPHRPDSGGPREHEFLQEMNREVLSHYDVMTVGETGSLTPEAALRYANLDGSELSMAFQFEHVEHDNGYLDNGERTKWTTGPMNLPKLKEIMARWQTALHGKAWNSLYWSNHDQPRAVNHFGCADEAYRVLSAKTLGACLHMMQGTPYIYQGEELGMTNFPLKDVSQSRDVEVHNAWRELVVEQKKITPERMMDCLRYKCRDNARTPMQWTAGKNAGFTTAEPWMPVNPNHTFINAESQVGDPDSVFSFYKRLIALRKAHPVIVHGDFTLLMQEDAQVFAYTREHEGKMLLVTCNFSCEEAKLDAAAKTCGELLIGNYKQEGAPDVLRAWECRVTLV